LKRAGAETNQLSVLDWGGGYGEYARAARRLLPDLAIDYHVVEVPTVCDYGGALFADVIYHDRDDAALDRAYDVVLAIGSLHYAVDCRETVERLAKAARRFLIVMDLPVASGAGDFTLTERPLAYMPEAVCLGSIVDAVALCDWVAEAGLTLERDLVPWRLPPIQRGPVQLTYRSFLFGRTNAAGGGA
jgi:putative methyltransferase (TIGR04325 family)